MDILKKCSVVAIGIAFSLIPARINALPGDSPVNVASWISSHPTLSPAISANGLYVKKSNTAAQRFTFQATPRSLFINRFSRRRTTIIESERFAFFDMINGVTMERLEETIRTIYGLNIYEDYLDAQVIYAYPTPEILEDARRHHLSLLAAQNGELRLGNYFAYWIEITETDAGIAYNGHVEIILKEDIESLYAQLSDR